MRHRNREQTIGHPVPLVHRLIVHIRPVKIEIRIKFAVGTRICEVQSLFRIHRDKNLHQREEPREDTLVRILFNLMHRLRDRHTRAL